MAEIEEEWPVYQPGERVMVPSYLVGVSLAANLGTIVGEAQEEPGFYLVHLDQPGRDWDTGEAVPDVLVAADNLERVAEPASALAPPASP
jgi:hypothetical protein